MKNKFTLIIAMALLLVATPIQTLNAEAVGDRVSGSLTQSWSDKGAGVANIKLTLDGNPVGGLNTDRILVGNPMAEVTSIKHDYSFTASQAGTYVVTLVFEQMASEATGGKPWATVPASVSKTHVVEQKSAVITTDTIVVDTITQKFTTSQIKTDSLFVGETKVTQAGVDGKISKTAIVTYTDGVETSRKDGPDKIAREMVPEIISVGTKSKETQHNKPVVKDPEPIPESKPSLDKDKDKDKDKVIKDNIDFTTIVKDIKIKSGGTELELDRAFSGSSKKYTVQVSPTDKELSLKVHYDETVEGVIVDYPETVNLKETDKAIVQITINGKLVYSYELVFIVDGSVIKEYSLGGSNKLYLTKDLDLNELSVGKLDKLELERNELGYYKLANGYLALLRPEVKSDTLLPAQWWVIIDDKPSHQVQPVIIGSKLYLLSVEKPVNDKYDFEEDSKELSSLFDKYVIKAEGVEETSLYGYQIDDSRFALNVYNDDNELELLEFNVDKGKVSPYLLGNDTGVKEGPSKVLLIVGGLFGVILIGGAVLLFFVLRDNKRAEDFDNEDDSDDHQDYHPGYLDELDEIEDLDQLDDDEYVKLTRRDN